MENTRKSVFVTGRAGTGKSTLLTYFRKNTKKRAAVLAPTGVAALNVRGQTIHSFFGFRPNITLEKVKRVRLRDESKSIYCKLDAIVIDEISMVRADLLDCVDRFLRLNGPDPDAPFGGIQMVFIGDLYQLPPVVSGTERMVFSTLYDSPYFYSARSFAPLEMEFIELEKVYRQQDQDFIDLLNAIRNNSITEEGLRLLNRRCIPSFEPPPGQFYIYLTTTNDMAGQINDAQLAKLKTQLYTFKAEIEGDFGDEYLPTRIDLQVKVGAQIMMLNNDPEDRWVNGTIGQITDVVQDGVQHVIVAELAEGETVEITPFTWEIYRFFVTGGQLQSEVVGRFTQYPLMLAWAVTIHKSQGKTFDRVVIDIGRGTFAHGQTYVALSRCTTLDGLVLKKPLLKRHVLTDYRVMKFLTGRKYQESEESMPLGDKVEMLERAGREKTPVHIIYLKQNDEKTFRTIMPIRVGEMEYQGKKYVGVRAFCLTRHEERTFRVDRILEMRV
ncbi:MAG: AAA family ATPase [Chloroflexi bacterium RBG_16_57_8]|nr:MAG: AAA family ATPase [Chloroflexi bacterium RBG_16_57_8]